MNWRTALHPCTLPCPWAGTPHCLLHHVSEAMAQSGHLGCAQQAGLRAVYQPHELPPCISPNGQLCWTPEEAEAARTADSPIRSDDEPDCPGM